jgi:hypothetical protein
MLRMLKGVPASGAVEELASVTDAGKVWPTTVVVGTDTEGGLKIKAADAGGAALAKQARRSATRAPIRYVVRAIARGW